MGILELPVELKLFASQIQMEGFVDYQKLPERIASVDINLAPLTDTIFNRAKSENKWVEAALVQTVTAASNLGAFAEMVQDGEDGVLCRDEAEWLEKLQWLIDDEPARKAIAGRAYGRCSRECVTIFHATGICEWVERHWNLRCAFVLPAMEISGGIRVALLHAEMLVKAGAQVSLFTLEGEAEWYHEGDFHFPVLSAEREKLQGTLDLAVATMWNTAEFVEQSSKIRKKKYLVQNFEVGFYPPGSPVPDRNFGDLPDEEPDGVRNHFQMVSELAAGGIPYRSSLSSERHRSVLLSETGAGSAGKNSDSDRGRLQRGA